MKTFLLPKALYPTIPEAKAMIEMIKADGGKTLAFISLGFIMEAPEEYKAFLPNGTNHAQT